MSETLEKIRLCSSQLTALQQLVVLTGAGVSAPSGIPTYRNDQGQWLGAQPIQHQEFIDRPARRRHYWARSMVGWPMMQASRPNAAHDALARMEHSGKIQLLVTQNVDRLHQRAGSHKVVDLHGRLDRVRCLGCGEELERQQLQQELLSLNPDWPEQAAAARPDGDAEIGREQLEMFKVPNCQRCGGVLMPDVVFFGGSVPRQRVDLINQAIERADALLAIGSSLTVWSGYRFCKLAHQLGKPLIIINRGQTRADELASIKLEEDCTVVLSRLAQELD